VQVARDPGAQVPDQGAVGRGIEQLGVGIDQFTQKRQARRDVIEKSRTRSALYRQLAEDFATSKDTDDWTKEETVRGFLEHVQSSKDEAVKTFATSGASPDALAEFTASAESLAMQFAVDSSSHGIVSARTVIDNEGKEVLSKGVNDVFYGDATPTEAVDTFTSWLEEAKVGMSDTEYQAWSDRVPEIYSAATSGMIMRATAPEDLTAVDEFLQSPQARSELGDQVIPLQKQSIAMRRSLTKAEETRASKPTSFFNPKTQERISVDINSPSGRAHADTLMSQGFHPVPVSVQAASEEGLTPSPAFVAQYTGQIAAANTSLDLTQRMREQVESGTFTGLTGEVLVGLDNVVGTILQAREATGLSGEGGLLNESLYDWSGSGDAAKSATYKANVMRLAYLNAMQMEPGARLTNQDIQRSIEMVGGNVGSKTQILALLNNVDEFTKMSTTNYHDAMVRQYGQTVPPLGPRLRYKSEAGKPAVKEALPPGIPEGSVKGKATLPDGTVVDAYKAPDGKTYRDPTGGSQ
jgi:hypothetical protein